MAKVFSVGGDDAGTLLPTMLKGVKTQIGDIGCLGMIIDSKDATHHSSPFRSMIIGEFRNPKLEFRNPKQYLISNDRILFSKHNQESLFGTL
jgi:hypothetical protein